MEVGVAFEGTSRIWYRVFCFLGLAAVEKKLKVRVDLRYFLIISINYIY